MGSAPLSNKDNSMAFVLKEEDFVKYVVDDLLTLLLAVIEFVLLLVSSIEKYLVRSREKRTDEN